MECSLRRNCARLSQHLWQVFHKTLTSITLNVILGLSLLVQSKTVAHGVFALAVVRESVAAAPTMCAPTACRKEEIAPKGPKTAWILTLRSLYMERVSIRSVAHRIILSFGNFNKSCSSSWSSLSCTLPSQTQTSLRKNWYWRVFCVCLVIVESSLHTQKGSNFSVTLHITYLFVGYLLNVAKVKMLHAGDFCVSRSSSLYCNFCKREGETTFFTEITRGNSKLFARDR